MYPFINEKQKIIFWWSPKCGCSTVKSIMLEMLYGEKTLSKDYKIHTFESQGKISLKNSKKYCNILFVRNPFKRFFSGIIDKNIDGELSYYYKPKNFLSAAQNVFKLDPHQHHFAPQIGVRYIDEIKFDKIYDIEYIDYKELSQICNYQILPRKKNQLKCINNKCIIYNAHLLDYYTLVDLKNKKNIPPHYCFYSTETIKLIESYYNQDFIFFKNNKFHYTVTSIEDLSLRLFQ
jgi:hypothetical protein